MEAAECTNSVALLHPVEWRRLSWYSHLWSFCVEIGSSRISTIIFVISYNCFASWWAYHIRIHKMFPEVACDWMVAVVMNHLWSSSTIWTTYNGWPVGFWILDIFKRCVGFRKSHFRFFNMWTFVSSKGQAIKYLDVLMIIYLWLSLEGAWFTISNFNLNVHKFVSFWWRRVSISNATILSSRKRQILQNYSSCWIKIYWPVLTNHQWILMQTSGLLEYFMQVYCYF